MERGHGMDDERSAGVGVTGALTFQRIMPLGSAHAVGETDREAWSAHPICRDVLASECEASLRNWQAGFALAALRSFGTSRRRIEFR